MSADNKSATAVGGSALSDGLGLAPERDLVERLRDMSRRGHWPLIGDEAADEIERLQVAMRRQIDYERLIADCFETTKQRQGSLGCRQFARGAEWWRNQVLKA